jgi:hypothetical protein
VILPPPSGADAKRKLEEAVARGAPLFNAGHHSECVTVYRATMNDLMSESLPNSLKTHMSTVLRNADHTQCTTEKAWVLRRGIDQMYQQLASQK